MREDLDGHRWVRTKGGYGLLGSGPLHLALAELAFSRRAQWKVGA